MKERIRRFAEDLVILQDDFATTLSPASEIIDNIRITEEYIGIGDVDWLLDYLDEDIEEYDGNPKTQDHADEAKRLMAELESIVEDMK